MHLPMFQVDAFTNSQFKGNPAAVVILEKKISADLMQQIAFENNLSETAFINISKTPFEIRWFTPTVEVDLCGHATLACIRIGLRPRRTRPPPPAGPELEARLEAAHYHLGPLVTDASGQGAGPIRRRGLAAAAASFQTRASGRLI